MGWGTSVPPPDPLIGLSLTKAEGYVDQDIQFRKEKFKNEVWPRFQQLEAELLQSAGNLRDDAATTRDLSRRMGLLYQNEYAPIQQQSARDAMGYDSADNLQQRMGVATANVRQAYDSARVRAVEEMAKYGVRLDPGAYASTLRRLGVSQANAEAGARTGVFLDTKDRAIALRSSAAQQGTQLGTMAGNLGTVASNQDITASNTRVTAQNELFRGLNFGNPYGEAAQTLTQIASTRNNIDSAYRQQVAETKAADYRAAGSAIGTVVGLAIASSKKFKDRNESLDGDDVLGKIKGLKVDRWAYKDDSQLHVGPYAEELHQKFGVGDGETIGLTDVGGIALAGVKQLNEKVEAIGKRLGLNLGS
jgi:hypothetical protein